MEEKKVYQIAKLYVEARTFTDKETKQEIIYQNYYTVVNGIKVDIKAADKTGRNILDQIERKEQK